MHGLLCTCQRCQRPSRDLNLRSAFPTFLFHLENAAPIHHVCCSQSTCVAFATEMGVRSHRALSQNQLVHRLAMLGKIAVLDALSPVERAGKVQRLVVEDVLRRHFVSTFARVCMARYRPTKRLPIVVEIVHCNHGDQQIVNPPADLHTLIRIAHVSIKEVACYRPRERTTDNGGTFRGTPVTGRASGVAHPIRGPRES